MTQGERVKKIRKELSLTLERFGEKLGVGKTAISKIEKNERSLTEQMLKAICREFNVNEHWLRTGEGDMFLSADRHGEISRFVNQLLQEETGSFKNRLISVLADLSVEEWAFLERRLKQLYEGKAAASAAPAETDKKTTAEVEAEYIKSILNSAQKTESIASNTTEGGARTGTDN